MGADKSVNTRSLYTVALVGLAFVALSNIATRNWLGLAYALCMLAAFALLRAGVPDRSRIGMAVYFLLIAGVFVLVTLSFFSD